MLRDEAANDHRLMRLKDRPFPRSDVIELSMIKNDVSKLMDNEEQAHHDNIKRKHVATLTRTIVADNLLIIQRI